VTIGMQTGEKGMTRKMSILLASALMLAFLFTACTSSSSTSKESNNSIKDVMLKLHNDKNGVLAVEINNELTKAAPDWTVVQQLTGQYLDGAKSLTMMVPAHGSKDSWTEHTNEYIELSRELDNAAKSQDKDKTVAAKRELMSTCAGCHKEHRPKQK
jgi:cytochrome c556